MRWTSSGRSARRGAYLESLAFQDAFLSMGVAVVAASSLILVVRFTPRVEALERQGLREVLAGGSPVREPLPEAVLEGRAGGK